MADQKLTNDPFASLPDAAPARGRRQQKLTSDPFASLPDVSKSGRKDVSSTNAESKDSYSSFPAGPDASSAGDTWSHFGPHAVSRFVKAAWEPIAGTVSGTWHGLVEGPQNPEEADIANRYGPVGLRLHRFVTGPMQGEYRKAKEIQARLNPNSPWDDPDRILMYEHAVASGVPLIGPALMQAGERMGTQYQHGDIAGAAGTLAGNVALYAAPKAIGKTGELLQPAAESVARRTINQLIRPMKGDVAYGKSPAAGILDEGITANTLESLGDKVTAKLGEVGQELDRMARSRRYANQTVDTSVALKPVEDAIREAVRQGNQPLFHKLQELRGRLLFDWAEDSSTGEPVLRAVGPRNLRVSPAEALRIKRMIGDWVQWSDDPLQGAANQTAGAMYSAVKNALNQVLGPEFERLNERYANLAGAAKAIQRRIPIAERNAHWSLSDVALGATGHIPIAITRKLAMTPWARTRFAKAAYGYSRANLPDAPLTVTSPATGAAEASGARLRELRDEAERRRLAAQP